MVSTESHEDPGPIVRNGRIQHATFELSYVLSKIRRDSEKVPFEVGSRTFLVRMDRPRYRLFRTSVTCAVCGLVGTRMVLETDLVGANPHFHLYGEEDGTLVLLTRDHVRPRCRGGNGGLYNSAVLCYPCNQLKDRYDLSYESVSGLRRLLGENRHLSRRMLNRLLHERRLLLDRLDGHPDGGYHGASSGHATQTE